MISKTIGYNGVLPIFRQTHVTGFSAATDGLRRSPKVSGIVAGKFPVTWVCLKMLCTPKPNGFADHYPYEKWLFHWEY